MTLINPLVVNPHDKVLFSIILLEVQVNPKAVTLNPLRSMNSNPLLNYIVRNVIVKV